MISELSEVSLELGHIDDANQQAKTGLELSAQIGDRYANVHLLAALAHIATKRGQPHRAGRLWGAIEAEETRSPIGAWEQDRDTYATAILAQPSLEFEHGRSEGRLLSLDDAITDALATD